LIYCKIIGQVSHEEFGFVKMFDLHF